jgi:peptidyl-prolyl cis-trans isomerase C
MEQRNKVHKTDFHGYRLLRIAAELYGVSPSGLNNEERINIQRIAERELTMEQAVLGSKEALQVVIPALQIEEALTGVRARYPDAESFRVALQESGLSEADLRHALDRELRVVAILERVSAGVPEVCDTDVSLFYYLHLDKFRQPETRTVRHILITVNPQFPENTPAAARKRLQDIRYRLQRRPHRFAEQALKHSECPSSLQDGLIGQVPRGTLFPSLDAALFRMQAGDLSEVIESPLGLHILLCEQIHTPVTVPLSDVMLKLREKLTLRQRKNQQKKWIKSLMLKDEMDTVVMAEAADTEATQVENSKWWSRQA